MTRNWLLAAAAMLAPWNGAQAFAQTGGFRCPVECGRVSFGSWLYVMATTPGNERLRLLVDTGSSISVLTKEAASRARADLRWPHGVARGKPHEDGARPVAQLRSVRLGLLAFDEVPCIVATGSEGLVCHDMGVDGILGMSALARCAVELDFGTPAVAIWPFGGVTNEAASRAGFEVTGTAPLAVDTTRSRTFVTGTINGKRHVRLLLDTGSQSTEVTADLVRALRLRTEQTGTLTRGFGTLQHVNSARVRSMDVGTVSLGAPLVDYPSDRRPSNCDGLLGIDAISHYRVIVDAPAGHLLFAKALRAVPKRIGMHLDFTKGPDWLVTAIDAGSPAAQAGIVRGERLISINGVPTRGLPTYRYREILEQSAGHDALCVLANHSTHRRRTVHLPVPPTGSSVTPEVWMNHVRLEELGREGARWDYVQRNLGALEFPINAVGFLIGQDDMARLAALLKARHIKVAIECGYFDWVSKEAEFALPSPRVITDTAREKMGPGVGEETARFEIAKLRQLTRHGIAPDYLNLDGPIRRMIWPGSDVGRNDIAGLASTDACVDELLAYMRTMRREFPKVQFFALVNFPNWGWKGEPSYWGGMFYGDYFEVLNRIVAKTRAAKMPILGVTADNPYEYTIGTQPHQAWMPMPREAKPTKPLDVAKIDWMARLLDLERTVKRQGLEFNLIVNSQGGGAASGEAFHRTTLDYLDAYRKAGGSAKRLILQTWYKFPEKVVPEDEPYTMTNLVKEAIERLKAK